LGIALLNVPVDMLNGDSESIQSRLASLFSEIMHVNVPSPDTDLFDSGILDSQRFVELLLHIEKHFNTQIDIDDFEIENFRCIEKIAALILQRQMGGKRARSSETGTPVR
jgi:methoxymalonate biosynthesis acyl carrier protein